MIIRDIDSEKLYTFFEDALSAIVAYDHDALSPVYLSPKHIAYIAKSMSSHQCGAIYVNFSYAPNTLYINYNSPDALLGVIWYTWRNVIYMCHRVAYSSSVIFTWQHDRAIQYYEIYNKCFAWQILFPYRYNRYCSLSAMRLLKRKGYILPPDILLTNVIDERYGMVLIAGMDSTPLDSARECLVERDYLCSSIGYIPLTSTYGTVEHALCGAGIDLPPDVDYTWENIEPYWVALSLERI